LLRRWAVPLLVAVGWAVCVGCVAYELAVRTDEGTHSSICNGIQCPSGFECRQQEFGKKCAVIEDSGGDVLYVALALLLGVPALCIIPVGCSFFCKRPGQGGKWQHLETHGIDSPKKKRRQRAVGKRHAGLDPDPDNDTVSDAHKDGPGSSERDAASSGLLALPSARSAAPESTDASGHSALSTPPRSSRRVEPSGAGLIEEGSGSAGHVGSVLHAGESEGLNGAGPFDVRIDVDTRMPESDQDFEDGEASDATSSEQASDLQDLFHVRPSQTVEASLPHDSDLGVSPEKIGKGDEETGSLLAGGESGLFAISPEKPRRGQGAVPAAGEPAPSTPQGNGGLWNMFFGGNAPGEHSEAALPSARSGVQDADCDNQSQVMSIPVSDPFAMADASPTTAVPAKTPSDLFGLSPEKAYEEVES